MADLKDIELLVLDVDGVLTDGQIILTQRGEEAKAFHARDGVGMKYWRRVGGKLAIISGRSSEAVLHRAKELDVDVVRLVAKTKLPVYREVLASLGVDERRAAVVGDDLPDLPLMRHCGLAVAVADAVEEVRRAADYVTALPGGRGAVREAIEMILKGSGRWEAVRQRYSPDAEETQP
jgi:3-deoxy-D-manno-octulosonate 8-phosphate phosphatase (KDO 8-P phosphatase)